MDWFLYLASTLAAIIHADASAHTLYNTSPPQSILARLNTEPVQCVYFHIVCNMDTDMQDSNLRFYLISQHRKHLGPLSIYNECKLAGFVSLPGIDSGRNTMMVTVWSGFLSLSTSRWSLFGFGGCTRGSCSKI